MEAANGFVQEIRSGSAQKKIYLSDASAERLYGAQSQYMRLFKSHLKLETNHRELLKNHQLLEGYHRELFKNHQDLERNYRNLETELSRVKEERVRRIPLEILKKNNLFLVGDLVIEAPYPPVSQHIRDALERNQYESVELYLSSQLIRPGDTVLDLGSGLGLSAITAAKAAQGGRVVGFEADPRVAQLARDNAARNDVKLEIRNAAISTEEGDFTFYRDVDFLSNSMFPIEGGTQITVPCAAFRKVIEEVRPNFISCDIEGVERDLFDGADLSSVRRVVLETHAHVIGPEGIKKCCDQLERAGLKKVENLCWHSVLVFDRDGLTTEIAPFTIKPTGTASDDKTRVYYAPFELFDVADPSIFDDVTNFRQSSTVDRSAPIVWYSPNWLHWWGGGIYTILRFAKFVADHGTKTIIYVYDNKGVPTLEKLRADMDVAFPGHNIEIATDITSLPVGHIAIATTHQSVFSVLRAPTCAARFYFMQEYESLLYPGGTQAEQANSTYQLGFKGICGGDWLRSIFQSYGGKAIKFDFSIDSGVFFPGEPVRDKVERLFFFGRPSSDRRMYDLGVAALTAINAKHPDVKIIIAGLDDLPKLPFPAEYLGNMKIEDTGELYRTVDLGLTLSGSNLSYLPLELMACGVPVLTNRGPQLSWYCKHLENSYCAYPLVSDFVRGFEALASSRVLREKLVKGGLESTAATTWSMEADKIRKFIETEVGW